MLKIRILFAISFQVLLINNAIAQYTIGSTIKVPSQIVSAPKQISKQQLLMYLLSSSNQVPLSERIEVLAAAVQHMPPRKNRRVYLADVLKQLAFQNLLVAASICGEATNVPTIPEYVTSLSRAVDYIPLSRQPPSLPIPRDVVVAKVPNQVPSVANMEQLSLLARELLSLSSSRNAVVAKAPNELPLVANKEQLSLLAREFLSSLSGDCVSNRAVRHQYV